MTGIHSWSEAGLPEQLAAVDLNLLVVFDALAREESVTRAAQRLGVTQSAVSHALRRLRALLDDPLLVGGRAGMALTPRAAQLVLPVRGALLALGRALATPAAFEPRTTTRAFTLSCPDLFDLLTVPALMAGLQAEAPGVDLVIVPPDVRRLSERLSAGEVDVAVRPRVAGLPDLEPAVAEAGLVRKTLFEDRYVCLLRRGHPALAPSSRSGRPRRLTLATYVALGHVLVSPSGEGPGPVDALLAQQGLRRRVALRVHHFASALAAVAASDLVLTGPTALTRLEAPGLTPTPVPLAMPPHSIDLVWHERYTQDPGHAWLRGLLARVARAST
jgi:DNA-binding transcriptional LysR family regulator